MSHTVVVAVIADSLPEFEPPVGDNRFDVPYADRLKIELDVEAETLGDIYRRAVEELEPRAVRSSDGYVANPLDAVHWAFFYQPEDERGFDPRHKVWETSEHLITVGPDGRARWNRPAEEIPFADLLRAADRGLLRGDPHRPYLTLLLPQGADAFQFAWDAACATWDVIGDLMTAYGIGELARRWWSKRTADDVDEGRKTVERYRGSWADLGAGPTDVLAALERTPWDPADLRILLGLDAVEDAEKVMRLFGLRPDPSGRYAISDEEEARLLRLIVWEAGTGRLDPARDEAASRARIERLLLTGKLPDEPL